MATRAVPEFETRHRMNLALEFAGISVLEIARELRISRTTVSNYLHGRTQPSHVALRAWAATCGVPLDWLETGVVAGSARATRAESERAELRRVLAERYDDAVAAIDDPDLLDQ